MDYDKLANRIWVYIRVNLPDEHVTVSDVLRWLDGLDEDEIVSNWDTHVLASEFLEAY